MYFCLDMLTRISELAIFMSKEQLTLAKEVNYEDA